MQYETTKYAVIIERASAHNLSGYVPDLPGCISTGGTRDECERNLAEAIEFHIEGLRLHGHPVPEPATCVSMVAVAA